MSRNFFQGLVVVLISQLLLASIFQYFECSLIAYIITGSIIAIGIGAYFGSKDAKSKRI